MWDELFLHTSCGILQKIFYTLQCFGAPEGPPGPKFTNLGNGVQQDLDC